jgi:hypothetical protein
MADNEVRNAALWGGAVGLGALWASRRMAAAIAPKPMWTGQVGDATLTLIQTGKGGRAWYELYAIADGAWWLAGTYAVYPQALTAVQQWQGYLERGGTVEAWVRHSLPQQGPRELR